MVALLRRGLLRVLLHCARFALLPIEVVAPRRYMEIYLRLLRGMGLRTSGDPRYISSSARFDDFNLTELGDRVVLSKRVTLLTHDYSVTTAMIALGETPVTDIGVRRPIRIGANVFVGMNVLVLPGTTIGDNVIVGAGSVVRGDIPADSIVVGNPGTVVGSITDRADRWRSLAESDYAAADYA